LPNELLSAAVALWAAAALVAVTGRGVVISRLLLASGVVAGIATALAALPHGTAAVALPTRLLGEAVGFRLAPDALWLMGFGLAPALFACGLGSPAPAGGAGWLFGAALSLIGALGVFGLDNAAAFLIAWELMSLGGAVMLLSENRSPAGGRSVLFMLALLEIGGVALLLAFVLLATKAQSLSFGQFPQASAMLPAAVRVLSGVLLVLGFGAKLGLLPFYEWFPAAYSAGSGSSGALLSGPVLNAALFALGRALFAWAPAASGLGVFVVVLAVTSAVLSALYAFQQEDWRGLLAFSSAENTAIALATIGAGLIFRSDNLPALASLAWTVALLHMAAHALAKGCLFLTADGVFRASGRYRIVHTDLLRRTSPFFGIGALFAAMSLAAMPPQAGFVSEWYVFETVFQGFHLSSLGDRLVLALAGAGLALTAAVAFAAFVKLIGIGLLGRAAGRSPPPPPPGMVVAVGLLGLGVLALAVGMPFWLPSLDPAIAHRFGTAAVRAMHPDLLLVPLTPRFAFISPTLLAIVMPLLAVIPLAMIAAGRRFAVRRDAVWYGGRDHDPALVSTTALTFANALRTFYSFVYRPREETARETNGHSYFVRRLVFTHEVAPIFGPALFAPATRLVRLLADRLAVLQSGNLNFYLALIGALLVLILALIA
jgi:hydrogenase-4 component B